MKSRWLSLCLLFVAGCSISVHDGAMWFDWARSTPVNPNVIVDPPKPDDKIVGREFRCLILLDEDNSKDLTAEQKRMLGSGNLRKFLKDTCFKSTDAKGVVDTGYRIVDYRTELTGVWAEMKSKSNVRKYPLVICQNGSAYTSEPWPANWDALIKLLERYAGVKQ